MDKLIEILEISVERNGRDKLLTLGHLLNILKMVQRREEEESELAWIEASYFDATD